jgi:hypothetical protein
LVEKDILSIAAFSREVLKIPILADTVFLTKLLPKLTANYEMLIQAGAVGVMECASNVLLLPHWPAWMVMISLF